MKNNLSEMANDEQFTSMVDDLVLRAQNGNDEDLKAGIKLADERAFENGTTIYESVFLILKKHMAEKRAKDWLKSKTG